MGAIRGQEINSISGKIPIVLSFTAFLRLSRAREPASPVQQHPGCRSQCTHGVRVFTLSRWKSIQQMRRRMTS
jgi:hypothetical protein